MVSEIHKRDIEYSSDTGHPWEAELEPEPLPSEPKKEAVAAWGEFIYGQSLPWYFSVIGWPIFILLLLEIGSRVMQTKYLIDFPDTILSAIISLLRIGIFVYLTIIAYKQYKATSKQTMAATVLAGLISGLILALFQLFWYLKLWAIFNLIGQPLLLAAEGLLISWLITKAFFRNK